MEYLGFAEVVGRIIITQAVRLMWGLLDTGSSTNYFISALQVNHFKINWKRNFSVSLSNIV